MKEYPYFIPGYTGFCPQLKDHFGQTYGHATRHIIQRNPNLKERLAPIHYKCGRYERIKGALGKQSHQQRNKYDYPSSKHPIHIRDASKAKHRPDFDDGDKGMEMHYLGYEDDKYRSKCYGDYKNVGPCAANYAPTCTNGVTIRKTDYEYICPKHVFTKDVAEFALPERWTSEDRQKLQHHERYPYVAVPCIHEREYIEHHYPTKKHRSPKVHVHVKDYHPGDCGHSKDAKFGTNHKVRRVLRIKPHRQGGVIPKYTGHVPGMMFSFGESYGPVSDRLLRNHHDRMKELKIKRFQ